MDFFLFKPPGKQVATLISIKLKPLGISSCLNKNGTNSYVFQAGADFLWSFSCFVGIFRTFPAQPFGGFFWDPKAEGRDVVSWRKQLDA